MKHITKGKEPKGLYKYRTTTDGSCYEGFNGRKELKNALLEEQGHICAYCMNRIKFESMKIEHWKCQTNFPELDLDYNNMLGVCSGKIRQDIEHCDTSKSHKEITINPSDKHQNCEIYIEYLANGKIYSDDENINQDLDETLNLNNQTLKNNRSNAWKYYSTALGKKVKGTFSKKLIQKEIKTLNSPSQNGKLKPYCQFLIYFLRKKLNSLTKRK